MIRDFILGTAQLGLVYGIANKTGRPSKSEAFAILEACVEKGVSRFDTARGYGDSESILGEFFAATGLKNFEVTSKLSPLPELSNDLSDGEVVRRVRQSLQDSCDHLRINKLPILLLHRFEHYHYRDGLIWNELLKAIREGLVGELGISVTDPNQILAIDSTVKRIQLPFNLLDQRWNDALEFAASKKVRCTVRSVFLQGVFSLESASLWPVLPAQYKPQQYFDQIATWTKKFGRKSNQDLAVNYVRAVDQFDGVIVGCESREQLLENLSLFENQPLSPAQKNEISSAKLDCPTSLLNPFEWRPHGSSQSN